MNYFGTILANNLPGTPSATFIMPKGDELYDRTTDPFQLNNVIACHPEAAKDLLQKLRLFMSDLQAS